MFSQIVNLSTLNKSLVNLTKGSYSPVSKLSLSSGGRGSQK